MSVTTIRNALGLLQDDPDSEQAWANLRSAFALVPSASDPAKDGGGFLLETTAASPAITDDELKLLEAARHAHEMRREYEAVAQLLAVEAAVSKGQSREADLTGELARVLDEEMFDDATAVVVYEKLLQLRPNSRDAEEAIEKSEAKRSRWQDLVKRYFEEAQAAGEGSFKSSLLVSAAQVAYRYGRPALTGEALETLLNETVDRLKEAIAIDPKNRRAGLLLERIFREEQRYEELAGVLEQMGMEATAKDEKIAGFVRLARVFTKRLNAPERAVAAYERVLDLSPGNPEATGALVDFFTSREMWDHLAALYEEQLTNVPRAQNDAGVVVQAAMVHWKMRGKPEAAEPYFERLRKIDPSHPGMLGFFREWCIARGEQARLAQILSDAQRGMPDSAEKKALSAEIAQLSEEGSNATKAIEQWRAILRQEPTNAQARESLKRLYRATNGWNALADLMRGELEKIPQENVELRLPLLREIALVYRDQIKSDSSLVSVLTQILQLAPNDSESVRELARVYEALGRWRDLLTIQARLAETEKSPDARAELYRAIARRWLDQFSNVQNAVEAYEKLYEAKPDDTEAIEKLTELYTKRRSYKPLYDLLARKAEALPAGKERHDAWIEMAKLAAERLDRGADATALYKRVLAEDGSSASALDALEKQAERDKDFATVAEVLEKRSEHATDDAAKLVHLQKLGALYSERLNDPAGAMRAWRRVLAIQPTHAKALRVLRESLLALGDYDALTELYASTNDWDGLADVLSQGAEKAADASAKIDLSYRAAAIYTDKLRAPERAVRAYERVLSVRPDDKRAVTALLPIYEKDEKWARLPALYEAMFARAESDAEKLAFLHKLTAITGDKLNDRAASFAYAKRAYAMAPDGTDSLMRLERAARTGNEWAGFAEVLTARLAAEIPAETKRALKAKIAEAYAGPLGRIDEAVAAYKEMIEADAKDEASLASLDRVLRAAGRRDDLRWLFDLRVQRADDAQKITLLGEWAVLEEESFGEPKQAIAIYRRMTEVDPNHVGALRMLARLLHQVGDAEGAVKVLERDRDLHQAMERAVREVELARLYTDPLRRYVDAFEAAKRALALAPHAPAAIRLIEALLPHAETRAKAAALLETLYAETNEPARQAEVLEVLIATAAAREDRLSLFGRLADVHERLKAPSVAFDVIARATSEFPTELAMWDRLAALAGKTQRAQDLVDAIARAVPPTGETSLPPKVEIDLAERAATLYDERIGDVELASPYLERILAQDPTNERAFGRLKQILTTRERWAELEALYERVVQVTAELTRRADLLAEVALIVEEITGEPKKAITYYERILDLVPDHDQAIRALDLLYAGQEQWEKLASLLVRRLGIVAESEKTALKLRLGTLYFTRLSDPKTALTYLDEVLAVDVGHRDAREIVEKILDVPELRNAAALVLERIYAARNETRDLVRVLEIRLEFAVQDEKRDLLRRVAELRDERLTDDAGALDAYARLVPAAPEDATARARLLDIARRTSNQERAASVLAEAARAAKAPQPRADILSDVAKLFEVDLRDRVRAEAAYKEVLALDPEDAEIALPAARALEKIYAADAKNAELAIILGVQVSLEDSVTTRRELLARLGDLTENVLGDPHAAITAWKGRVADDPSDAVALEALDRLYERTNDWRALVDVLRARERLADHADVRKTFMQRSATTLADKLKDTPEAILAYRAILDDFGADRATLGALASLYQIAERWPDVAETLSADLALADAAADRIAILAQLGAVKQERLADVSGALEMYRQALSLDGKNAASRSALEALLADKDARREAASILRPLYEFDSENTQLLRVLDIEAEYASSASDKLALYFQAANVAEGPLGDPARAFAYASRALGEAASEPTFKDWLERGERLARLTSRHAELVELLKLIAPDIADADVQLEVLLKIADLARNDLKDIETARTFYLKALDLRADDERALIALESLYEQAGDAPALLGILKRRAEIAVEPNTRKAILFKTAKLLDETLKDRAAAIDVYAQILEIAPDDEAFAALDRLYTAGEQWDEVLDLYARQLGMESTPAPRRAELHHKTGRVLEDHVHDVDRAFDAYEAALKSEPQHEPTIGSLETLMAVPAHASRAAEMLEVVYIARLDGKKVLATLEARLGASQDPDERRQILRRLAKLHEEQDENYQAALATNAKLLGEDITDEATWTELERLARVANDEARLGDIFAAALEKISTDEQATARLSKRTAAIFEKQGDPERALVFHRRAYAFAPDEDTESFEAIDRLLAAAKRHVDRVALYKQSLEHRADPSTRLKTLRAIAQLQETELGDDDAAIDSLKSALEVDESDMEALDSLTRLYGRRERYRDLADLLRKRAEQSALPDDEAKYRLELAKLLQGKLSETAAAVDEYRAVVESITDAKNNVALEAIAALEALVRDPEQKARVVEILRPIYERTDDWRHLVEVNAERLDITSDDGEKIAILRETARIWEERGKDNVKAFDAIRRAFVLDPDDGELRSEVERLALATTRWDQLAETYEKAIENAEGVGKRELLAALATLHDRKRDDPRRALEAWGRVFKLDESDAQPLDEMDLLATLLSDWNALVWILGKRAELTHDDEERALLWRRAGEARRDMLDDAAGAIEAYEKSLDYEPDSRAALDALIVLFEAKDDAAKLVTLYKRRVELSGDDESDRKFELLVLAATRYETGLNDRREAIALLNEALVVKPADLAVTKRLDVLLTAEKSWPELLDNLRAQSTLVTDAGEKRELTKRIGGLLAGELEDPAQALAAFKSVIEAGYDEEATRAIRAIGESREDLRAEVADALEPVLRAAGKHADLAEVLEMRLRAQTEANDRAATLRALAKVAESDLADPNRALGALLRALAEEPESAALHAEIERINAVVGREGWERYADALSERAGAIFDAKVQADLFARLGHVSEEQVKDEARAARAYVQAAEAGGDNAATLGALDRLFGRLGDTRALSDVLERRIAFEADANAQAEIYHRRATLQIREFGEKSEGLATLRLALEKVNDHAPSLATAESLLEDDALFDDAFDALEGVYRAQKKTEDLARLFERRVKRAADPHEKTRARLELAKVFEVEVGDAKRAQRAVEEALADDPGDMDALGELERLAGVTSEWRAAADTLKNALTSAKALSANTAGDLWLRLAGWYGDKVNDAKEAEDAFSRALESDPDNAEILRALEKLRRGAGREAELIATLRKRAKVEHDVAAKRALYREASELADNTLKDAALSEEILRELLAEDESDEWALEGLTTARARAEDWREVVTLLLRRAERSNDGAIASKLKYEAARTASEKMKDTARAIALYEEIFEADANEVEAATQLRALYLASNREKDLAKLLTALIDNAKEMGDRTRLRLELATLQREKFESPRDAVETLRALLDEDGDNAEGVAALTRILESTGQDEELAELIATQVERARDRKDDASALAQQLRLGEVFESRLKDAARALSAYEVALEIDKTHRGSLEAVARLAESRGAWDRAATALEKLIDASNDGTRTALSLRLAAAREHLEEWGAVEVALKNALEHDTKNAEVRAQLRSLYEKQKNWAELASLLLRDADLIREENPSASTPEVDPEDGSTPPPPPVAGPIADQVRLLRRAAEIHLDERSSPADAVPLLERASSLLPRDRDLLLLLSDAYAAASRNRDVATVLEKIIASFGSKKPKELSLYHHRLGRALAQLGDKSAALAQYDLAFKIDPGSIDVLRDLGVLALETNDLERAQKTFRALLLQKLEPETGITKGEVFFYLGEISAKQGDKVKAVQMLERAIESEPSLDRAKAMLNELKG